MKRRDDANQLDDALPHDPEQSRLRLKVLEGRLEDGYRRIDEAIEAGDEVESWEDFWLTLLRQYETLCDELTAA
ncbi:MAG TPA: hypothetical protein VFL82_15540 [Thermomicrobiales bacterium]|nr:hypothetical protein [Thermomicrobiales bacterium]